MDPARRKKLRELEVKALRLVDSRLMGEWASNVRGQGLEFRDLREYVAGDDVRRLDWKATARSGKPQLRTFQEDRQQTIWFVTDLSASMGGGKQELAREMLATLAWAAVRQGDRFGLMGFSDREVFHRRPGRGESQLWAALETLLAQPAGQGGTSLDPVTRFFLHHESRRATLIILSDFIAPLDERTWKSLAARHEVLAFQVVDALEADPAMKGLVCARDPETGERHWHDPGSPRDARARSAGEGAWLHRQMRTAGAWHARFVAGEDFVPGLLAFFRRREAVLGY